MLKDLTLSHFWILTRMGMDMQRIWDLNYSVDGETVYIDYKEFYGYENGGSRKNKNKKNTKEEKENNNEKDNSNTTDGENNVNEGNMGAVASNKSARGKILFTYTRYKIYIPNRKLQRTLSVIGDDEYDYDKYFEQNHLTIM